VITGDPRKDAYAEDPFICTRFGQFHINKPEFNVKDIAHALSQICRYTGHTKHFYSVAEHSLLVAGLMLEVVGGDPFEGLLHDAAEAYLSDIATPWKHLLPDYEAVSKRIEVPLRAFYGIPERKSPECKQADQYALFIEAYWLMEDRGDSYHDPLRLRPDALRLASGEHPRAAGRKWKAHGLDPYTASQLFLGAFKNYRTQIEIPEKEIQIADLSALPKS